MVSPIDRILVAFTPIHIGNNIWSIAVAMDQDVISGPINRNTRDNLIFTGFVFLIFFVLGELYYRTQKKRDKLLISEATLNIINKQLHLEIGQRKKIEENLQNSLKSRRRR